MMFRHSYYLVAAMGLFVLLSGIATPTQATLKFYYDPATGNVSFDTSETRSGALYHYFFDIEEIQPRTWEFRSEELVRLSLGTIFTASDEEIGEATFTNPWQGLYTIGNAMPIGLSEEVWTHFVQFDGFDTRYVSGDYGYVDLIGGGDPPPAQLIYGPPEGEFQNKWDLVDPDSLTWATAAKLIYRDWNGEVLIDTTGEAGGYMSSFGLKSAGMFRPEEFTPFASGPLIGADTDSVYQFADAIAPGRYSVGRILPPGLSLDEFQAIITEANFIAEIGFHGGSFDFETDGIAMSFQFVPEPGALLLACAALAYAFASTRRTVGQ